MKNLKYILCITGILTGIALVSGCFTAFMTAMLAGLVGLGCLVLPFLVLATVFDKLINLYQSRGSHDKDSDSNSSSR